MTGVAQQTGFEEFADSEVVLDSQEETSLVATSAEVHNIHFPSQIANVLSLCRVIVKTFLSVYSGLYAGISKGRLDYPSHAFYIKNVK